MAISPEIENGPFIGNGTQAAFAFTFTAITPAEVAVLVDGVVQPGGYTVALGEGGGTVTFAAPPPPVARRSFCGPTRISCRTACSRMRARITRHRQPDQPPPRRARAGDEEAAGRDQRCRCQRQRQCGGGRCDNGHGRGECHSRLGHISRRVCRRRRGQRRQCRRQRLCRRECRWQCRAGRSNRRRLSQQRGQQRAARPDPGQCRHDHRRQRRRQRHLRADMERRQFLCQPDRQLHRFRRRGDGGDHHRTRPVHRHRPQRADARLYGIVWPDRCSGNADGAVPGAGRAGYWVQSADGIQLDRYTNVGGVATAASGVGPVPLNGGTTATLSLAAAAYAKAVNLRLVPARSRR